MDMKNSGMDLLISFDTTGSMYPVLSRVRNEVKQLITEMMGSIPNLRIGIIAHGDYCDKDNPYTIRIMPFTTDVDSLCSFVKQTEQTYGGDADECYELVLNAAAHMSDWREDRSKAFILIGDANPHSESYHMNTSRLSWRHEAEQLGKMGVKIFSVHALSYYRNSSKRFYQTIADVTNGTYLTLDQFDEVTDLIKATCLAEFSEEKLTEYISLVRNNGRMTHTLARNFGRLQGEDDRYMCDFVHDNRELVAVKPGRFQAMKVDKDCDIRSFVTGNGIEFKKGRGFYELTKHETVQQYKEIIIQDRETGEMFTGGQVRKKLGLLPQCEKGGAKESLSSYSTRDYRVFVQSTSVNRKLIGGTTFLYEVSDFMDTVSTVPEVLGTSEKITKKVDKKEHKHAEVKVSSETVATVPEVETIVSEVSTDTPKGKEKAAKKSSKAKKKKITATQKSNIKKATNSMVVDFAHLFSAIETTIISSDKGDGTIEDVIALCNELKGDIDSIITNIE